MCWGILVARTSIELRVIIPQAVTTPNPGRPSESSIPVPQVVARMAKSTGDRHWHVAAPVLIGAMGLAAMPIFMSRVAWAAFACLSLAGFGIWAGHGPLMSWPAVLLSGTNAASGERPGFDGASQLIIAPSLSPAPLTCSEKHMSWIVELTAPGWHLPAYAAS